MNHKIHRRALSLLLCFTLTLGCAAYRPQKASAVVTETAIAFGIASLIPYAISTGMKLNATNGGAEAIASGIQELWNSFYTRWKETDATIARSAEDELAYIGGQILPTYKNGALTLSDYVVSVYDKFVQWLMGEKGVTEGGEAVEVANILDGITFSSCTSNYTLGAMRVLRSMAISYAEETTSLVHSLGIGERVLILGVNKEVFSGYFFNDDGVFCLGVFKNPYESVNASFLGIYEMDSLELLFAGNVYYSTDSYVSTSYDRRIFYDKYSAEAWTGFLLGSCVVLNFSVPFVKSNAGTCLNFLLLCQRVNKFNTE